MLISAVGIAAGLVYWFSKPGTPKYVLIFTCFGYTLGILYLLLLLVDIKIKIGNEVDDLHLLTWWRVLYWS